MSRGRVRDLETLPARADDAAHILGDFSPGTRFARYGREYEMGTRGNRHFISISQGRRPVERFEVHYTLGAKRFQGYLSKLPDGRIYVLPAFWHVETAQWVDFKEITPLPDRDHGEQEFRQIWNVNCFNCHATNLVQNFDLETRSYATTWSELGIGCEACHGPGAEHAEWMRRRSVAPGPAAGAARETSAEALRVFSPRKADRRQVFDMCAYCHGNKNNFFADFVAGDRYTDHALPFLISEPIPHEDPQGDFWPDGRPTRFNRPQAIMQTGCFQRGQLTCTNCHAGHGSPHDQALKVAPAQRDTLCTQCHQTLAGRHDGRIRLPEAIEAHTHHPAGSEGSRCVQCHMSEVNWRMLHRRRDHTFAPPVPELTARYGVPNACTTCHDSRTPEWAAAVMDRWYGDGDRRREAVRVADIMYAAGSGDAGALGGLAALAVNRQQGPLVRASAAEFIGRLVSGELVPRNTTGAARVGRAPSAPPVPDPHHTASVINALLGAANDPEPVVRAAAVRALGITAAATGDVRGGAVPAALAARLDEDVRLVRVAAAAALLRAGIVVLAGEAGERLARAQEEYAASLRAFPDGAHSHTGLAWLDMSRGRLEEAEKGLGRAVDLDPADPELLILRGVIRARAGRLDEAIAEWEAAKRLQPDDPRADRLIAEARKQKISGGR